jgi:hypothetical protein
MLARHFLIGVMALATVPSLSGQQVVKPFSARVLLALAPLSDEISSLRVTALSEGAGSPAFIEVSLVDPRRLSGQTIQAWLLNADGTAVATMPKSFHDRPTEGFVIPDLIYFFDFVSVPAKELAGVVVSVNGKLYAREIKAS